MSSRGRRVAHGVALTLGRSPHLELSEKAGCPTGNLGSREGADSPARKWGGYDPTNPRSHSWRSVKGHKQKGDILHSQLKRLDLTTVGRMD